jgi:hypothetical protein
MDWKDVVIMPVYLLLLYLIVYLRKKKLTNPLNRNYYLSSFHLKVIGAMSVGLIYQFYYKGGDTINFQREAYWVWEALINDFGAGVKILFSNGEYDPSTYAYTSRMQWYNDSTTFPIIKLVGFISFFTFHTYSINALCFALFSFFGLWALHRTMLDMYPQLAKSITLACFWLPSVVFWGSGLLKDTITLGALGWFFYGFYFGIIKRENIIKNMLILFVAFWIIKSIKIYIILSFLPALSLWLLLKYREKIKNKALRALAFPLLIILSLPIGYVGITQLSQGTRYSVDEFAKTTKTTADWLHYVSESQGGSSYSLGEFDGSIGSVISKFPKAVWTTLFQPYIWEARNPVMLLSAFEALFFLFLTIKVFWQARGKIFQIFVSQPLVPFCFLFTIIFAFGVGVNSYNFGTLVRYKIPMMPFYITALYVLRYYSTGSKKLF